MKAMKKKKWHVEENQRKRRKAGGSNGEEESISIGESNQRGILKSASVWQPLKAKRHGSHRSGKRHRQAAVISVGVAMT